MLLFVVFALQVTVSLAAIRQYEWWLENDQVRALDGAKYTRPVVTINRETLGPILHADKGDVMNITVFNAMKNVTDMDRVTSIHWHGLFMKDHALDDGGAFLTQCPIPPNVRKGYSYYVPTAGQTGTFWYHGHYNDQYCDGLRGPIIIKDPEEAIIYDYDIDDDTTVIHIADWYHVTSVYNAREEDDIVLAASVLVNAKGRYGFDPDLNECKDEDEVDEDKKTDLHVFNVTQGKKMRYRVVNTSCMTGVTFSIDGHKLRIIEADGVLKNDSHPALKAADALDVFPGQRYSFVLEADQPVDNYWVRVHPLSDLRNPTIPRKGITIQRDTFPDCRGVNLAILRYDGAKQEPPKTKFDPRAEGVREEDFQDRVPTLVEKPDKEYFVEYDVVGDTFWIVVNGDVEHRATFKLPDTSILLQILSGNTELVPKDLLFDIRMGDVVRVHFNSRDDNDKGVAHPWHLHGHTFQVIQAPNQTKPLAIGDATPLRDVLPVWGMNKWITIQFKADNPGPWIAHCHLEWHLTDGLAILFVEEREKIRKLKVPPAWTELCRDWEKYKQGLSKADDPIYHDTDQILMERGSGFGLLPQYRIADWSGGK